MNKYDLVVFDVDGTVLDTREGVLAAVRHTIEQCGLEHLSDEALRTFIGPPVQNSFKRWYHVSDEEAQRLANVFRDKYKGEDLLKAVPYDGIYDVFEKLQAKGVKTAVATYKREDYAIRLLEHFKFDHYSDILHGADNENKLKKKDIIELCINESGITDRSRIVMIGDSDNDAIGAEGMGISFVGVTYGFGFSSKEDIDQFNNSGCADTAEKILEYVL